MLLIVLTYIALNQTALEGLFTILIYAIGQVIPLIMISSLSGSIGKKIKGCIRMSGDAMVGLLVWGLS